MGGRDERRNENSGACQRNCVEDVSDWTPCSLSLRRPSCSVMDSAEASLSGEIQLEREWVCWYDGPLARGACEADWEKRLTEIGRFRTVQGFWRLWSILDISKIVAFSNYRIFAHPIRPKWEDKANDHGGKFSLNIPKTATASIWMELGRCRRLFSVYYFDSISVLSMIGEDLPYVDEITGIVLSNRPRSDAISIWIRNCCHAQAIKKLTSAIERVLQSRGVVFGNISFAPHRKGLVSPNSVDRSPFPKIAESLPHQNTESTSLSASPLQSISISRSASDLTSPSILANYVGLRGSLLSSSDSLERYKSPGAERSSISSACSVENSGLSIFGSFHCRNQSYNGATTRQSPFRRCPSSRAASRGFSSGTFDQAHIRTRSSDGITLKDRLQVETCCDLLSSLRDCFN